MRKTTAVVGVALALMTATVAGVMSPATAHAAAIVWRPCPPPTGGLPDAGQQCATISVPRDYANPAGPQITVAISKVAAAQPSQRRGVLLLNPGGPGGSGLDLPRAMTVLMASTGQDVLNKYDLIGFDPRGVGASTPVSCGLTPTQGDQAIPTLMQNGSFPDTVAFVQHVAQGCGATTGSLLPYINTANTAQDMDQIRQALGESRISYFAYSYGTYLGVVYASLFPAQVDRFVIDSNVNPAWVWRTQFRAFGLGGAIRFPDFLNFAAAHDNTYHLGNTPSAVHQTFNALLAKLRQNPVTLADGTVINDAYFRELSFFGISDPVTAFDGLATIWQAINQNQPLNLQQAGPNDNQAASGLAVVCNDAAWSRTVNQYWSEYSADTQTYPDFGPVGSNIWPCAFWPNATPSQPTVAITSAGPTQILVVQSTHDPVTPYPGGVGMAATLGNRARLLTDATGIAGHGDTYLAGVSCVDVAVSQYLAAGVLPAPGAVCTQVGAARAAVGVADNVKAARMAVWHGMGLN